MMVLNSKVVHGILEDQDISKYDLTLKVKGKDLLTSIMINSPEILDVFDALEQFGPQCRFLDVHPGPVGFSMVSIDTEANGQAVWFGLSDTSHRSKREWDFRSSDQVGRAWDTGRLSGSCLSRLWGCPDR